MKIAVACDGLRTSSHAARCGSFMCYTVEKGVITDCRNLPNMGVTSQEAADLINGLGFDAIITNARCGSFMCYTVEKGVITDCRNLPNMGVTSQEAADLINGLGFDAIITKGIDMDMAEDLCASGVEVVAGVDGTSREVVESYVTETLLGAVSLYGYGRRPLRFGR